WGRSKSSDPETMGKIADVMKGYDIIAVQEISNVREMSDDGCPRNQDRCPGDSSCDVIRNALEYYLNEQHGLGYEFVFSPQVKDERYLYVYNPLTVELVSTGLVEDDGDSLPICDLSPESTGRMIRQPFRADFMAGDFGFTLVNTHTSPGINRDELAGLEYFFIQAVSDPGMGVNEDVVVLGDLNAGCSYLGQDEEILLRNPEYIWAIPDNADTTVSQTNCSYDRFIFRQPTEEDFTGRWGMDRSIPDSVSDHYLVWAQFYTDRDSD
ncbi:MAG: hypothetical protein ACXABY_12145, partial [Candidatus Thorarchaeota archaeon]